MRDEYDFSNAQGGKFYKHCGISSLPVYLEAEVLDFFERKAKSLGIETEELLNATLKQHMDEKHRR